MASIYDDDEKKRRAEAEQAIKRLSSDTTSSLGQTMSARMQDTTPSVVQSPIQQVMSMPMSTGSNWYSGKVPTQSEVLARIYQIGQQNYEQGRTAYNMYQQQKMDPSSPLYSPYDSPTNKAIFELQKLGYNIPSTGVTREWLEANRGLLANARFTTTGDSPAAPTTKSSKEQNAAYWYYQLLKDEDTTEAAENEWKALQDEVTYWAKRADRNMTDEEILAKIDWTKYKTLGRMDDALYTSVATSLNRGVEYSKDNLLGVIWAARNGSTGSATMDTVSSRLGRGNGYVENADIRQYLDPMSPNYNPYLVGSAGDNMDKAALYFGVDHFDKDWLENNRQYLASNDATAQKLYQQVYTAEQTTQAAEEELKKLNEEIEAALQFCSDPDQILDIIDFDDYKTLSKMRESLQSGKTMDTTRAIDFDYNEIVKKINDECSKVNSTRQTPDVVDDIAADYGSTAPTLDGDKAVQAGKDNAINAAGPVIKDYGTPEEQKVIKNAYTFKFNEYVRKLDALHKDGKLTADTAYNTILKATSNYSASKYVPNARVVKDYEARQKELEENAKQIDVMEARLSAENLPSLSPELAQAYTDKLEKLKQRNNVLENLIERDASKYKKASAELAKVNQAYDNAQQIADMNGLQPEQTVDQHKQMMDMIVEFGQRNINNVPAYTIYDYALQSGEKTQEELYPIAESKLAEAQDNLDTVNKLLDWINTNKVEVDSATMQNIRLVRDQMETSIKDSQYFLLRNSKDFSSKVEEFKQQVSEYWKDQNWFSKTWGGWTGYEYSDAAIAVIDPALFMDGSHANSILYMDDVEKDTYMYLYATEGKEAAEEYMAYMTDSSYGKLNTRVTERMTEFAMDMFGGDIDTDPEAIDATLASIIMAPMQITGFLYGVKQLVTGREINPNDTAYVWNNIVSNFRGQSKEQFLAAANGNKAAEFFIGLGYDAVTSGADSLVNNTLTGGILGGKEAIEALGAAGNVISALPMGLQATGGTMQDLAMRGASAGQIALLSGITAAAETLTESIHIGGIEDAKTPKTIKERLSQGFVKALQLDDAVGEALNEAIEGMSDDFIMGEYSQRETRINELIESGMDAEHAELQAYAEFGQDILMAALTGAVSSNISEGVTSFVSRRITPTSVNNTQETQDSTQNNTENQEQNTAINNQTQATETLTPEEMSQAENEPVQPMITDEIEKATDRAKLLADAMSEESDTSARVAVVASAIAMDNTPANIEMASAAAQSLVDELGIENVPGAIQSILLIGSTEGVPTDTLNAAITTAALSDGTAHELLVSMVNGEGRIDNADVLSLVDVATQEAQEDAISNQVKKRVVENLVAQKVRDKIGEGALSGIQSFKEAVRDARKNLQRAKIDYERAVREEQAASDNMKTLVAKFQQNPSDNSLKAAVQSSFDTLLHKQIAATQAEQTLGNNQQSYDGAKRMLEERTDQEMTRIREEARAEVEQELAERDQAAKEQAATEAQAQEEERVQNNAINMDADSFIEQYYPDATEDEKNQIRERFSGISREIEDPQAAAQRQRFVQRIGQKFGVNIEVRDTSEGGTKQRINGSYDPNTNTIVLDTASTQSDAIYAVALHELTHVAERSGMYDQLASSLVRIAYANEDGTTNKERLANDIRARQSMYNERLAMMAQTDSSVDATPLTSDQAAREVVADLTNRILNGDQELINRLVADDPSMARRFLDGIKNFLKKLARVDDPAVTQIRKTQELFEKALKDATKNNPKNTTGTFDSGNEHVQYSLREEDPPQETLIAYKAFYAKDGKLYPPMVTNQSDETNKGSGTFKGNDTPVGVWLDADVGGILLDENGEPVRAKTTGRLKVQNAKSGGKEGLAFRPGWHLGEWPDAKQFNKMDPVTKERGKLMPDNLVFAKCEIAADVDYQLQAMEYGVGKNGKFNRTQAGYPMVPKDGYYKYRTNPDPNTAPWYITGAMKVVEILDDDMAAEICAQFGVTPDPRYSGKKIDLSEYGLKAGPVEPTADVEKYRKNDTNRANDELLERALSDSRYSDAYVRRSLDFTDPTIAEEFKMNNQDMSRYAQDYKGVQNPDSRTQYSLPESDVEEAAKAAGYNIHAYHGTARADRVGNEFRPDRATSGPMAFFTSSKDIASNYASNKRDTSIAYDSDYDTYETQFRASKNGKSESLVDLWNKIPYNERRKISEAASHVTLDDDGENIVVDRSNKRGVGNYDYELKNAKGNAIQALEEGWLNGGTLYNEESRFIEVLDKSGVTDALEKMGYSAPEFMDPYARHEKVYDVYLSINNPFNTSNDYNSDFIEGLKNWWNNTDQSKYNRESSDADMWDKNNISVDQWIEKATDDIKNGTTYAWTQIPDAVTDYLKENGYDGIEDLGGKHGGDTHTVYIPFSGEQVKSAEEITTDNAGNPIPLDQRFNPNSRDIRYSLPSDSVLDDQIRQYLSGGYNAFGGQNVAQNTAQNVQYAKQTAHPNQPARNATPNGSPKRSPQQIANGLMKALSVGNYVPTTRDIPKNVLGYYQTRAKYIAATPKEAGVFTTTMHEIGHAIQDKLGIVSTPQMVQNLIAQQPAFAASYTAAELPGEAFAEFMWRYMSDEQSARNFAGDAFVENMEREMRNAGIYKDVQQAANELRQWVNASTNEKIGSVIVDKSRTKKTPIRELIEHAIADIVDETSAAEKVNKSIRSQKGSVDFGEDVRKNALMKNFSSRRAFNILSNDLTDASWTRIGDGLAKRLEDAGMRTKEDFDTLNRYMLAKHSLARDAQGKPVFDVTNMTEQQRRQYIDDIDAKDSRFAAANQALHEFWHDFMQAFMVDTGYLSQEGLDLFEDMYPDYVPTFRAKEDFDLESSFSRAGFTIKKAVGSTEDIINPIDSMCDMVSSIVNMVSANNANLAWHNAFQNNPGMGIYGREVSSPTKHSITVQLADGSQRFYEIADKDLYMLLSSQGENSGALVNSLSQTVGRLTRTMSVLTTGSNPVFAVRNFMRDFQNSVNYGSWAYTYVDGFANWVRAAADVWFNKGEYQDYVALGGGGWTRVDTNSQKGASEIRGELFKKYDNNAIKKVGEKLWSLATLERINEVVEQTSRYAEYKFGKAADKSTAEGRQQAFLNAQEATVDFARKGYGNLLQGLKQVVPFIGASTQGVYRTARMFSEAERSRLAPRLIKSIINTALSSALCFKLLMGKDDEDKEAFATMSDDLVAQNFYLPNFAPQVFGQQPLIRIPVAQDPLMYAVHGGVTKALWEGTTDQDVLGIASIANTIIDNLNVFSGGPVWSAITDVGKNRNWYGSRITPTRMDSWESSTRYSEDTPDLFIGASRVGNWALDKVGATDDTKNMISPLNLQYLAEQYTGYIGQMVIPALKKNKYTGENQSAQEMVMSAITAAQKRLTTDPLISNEVVSAFYDGSTFITQVSTAAKNNRPLNLLKSGLTPEQASEAANEAKALTSKGGILYETKSIINDLYTQIDNINGNDTLSNEEKYTQTSQVRREMIKTALYANEAIEAYRQKWVTGEDISLRAFEEGAYGTIAAKDTTVTLSDTFKNDADQRYMQMAQDVYNATGKAYALPHPKYTVTIDHKDYEVDESFRANFDKIYKEAYNKYLVKIRNWADLNYDERLRVMKGAHDSAQSKATNEYYDQVLKFMGVKKSK